MTEATVLFRQIHQNFINENNPTSQAFMPFPKDKGFLSVYDGDMIHPKDAYRHFTQTLGFSSHSVWGVTKSEAESELLPCLSDPQPGFDAHSVIDFTGCPEKEYRKKAKRLLTFALTRKCLYIP